MNHKKKIESFKSIEELAQNLGFSEVEAELISMKGTVISHLDKTREVCKFNNSEFANYLGIPKSRWSSIYNCPEKVTLDYLLVLAAKCGTSFRLVKRAA